MDITLLKPILEKAKYDAEHGQLEALTWLVLYAIPILDQVYPSSDLSNHILIWCKDTFSKMESGKIPTSYNLEFLKSYEDSDIEEYKIAAMNRILKEIKGI